MRRRSWKDELPPLIIAAAVQFVILRGIEWAKKAADAGDPNARNLVDQHFFFAPQVVAAVIVFLVFRFVRNVLDMRGVRVLDWLRSSALVLFLGLAILLVAHLDQFFGLLARFVGLEWMVLTAKALRVFPAYAFVEQSLMLRFAVDLVGLLVCLLGLRFAKPVPSDVLEGRSAERSGDYMRAGELYLKAGNVKRAKAAFKKAKALPRLAALELREGNAKEAAELYERAGAGFAWDAARAWDAAGDRDKTAAATRAALNEARATLKWDRLAEIAEAMGDNALIAEASRRLAEVKPPGPGKIGLYKRAAEAARAAGQPLEAAESYRAAGEFLQAAELFQLAGRPAEAAHDFERGGDLVRAAAAAGQSGNERGSLELTARDAEARGDTSAAAEAWYRVGNLDRAAGLFERAGHFVRAAEVQRELKHPDRAAPLFQRAGDPGRAAQAFEESGQAERAATLYRELGNIEKAAALFRAAGRWADAAAGLEALGQYDEASNLYLRAGKGLPAARCALLGGHREKAWELLTTVKRSEPGVADLFVQLGEAHLAAGEVKDAEHILRELLGHSPVTPENVRAHDVLVRALEARGQTAEAEQRRARILEVDPTFVGGPAASLAAMVAATIQVSGPPPTVPLAPPATTPGSGSAIPRPPTGNIPSNPATVRGSSGVFTPPPLSVTSSGTFPSLEKAELRYEIVAELGRGGMGVVHKALDKKLDRYVALKILPWQLFGDETAMRYFAREARAIAALKHPNVVSLYDYGEGFGSLYLAMEFLEGPNLQTLLKSDPELIKRRWRGWFVQAARGVAAAHAKGILHRDIKPANLMLDEHETLRILDFGLARPESDSQLTSKLIGTPAFFPPELLRGEPPTPASDVYSLGATFYTLATGRWPYVGDDVLVARLERDPDDPRPHAPFLTAEEVVILMKSLARHRPERYPDCGELLGALLSLEG